MLLADRVTVSRRFQRATRVDTDLRDLSSLEGFVCPDSSAGVLTTMAHHVAESAQGAFTWTGPYGSGKSSLAVVLSALLNGNSEMRAEAASAVGPDVDDIIRAALPRQSKGWRVLPVVGRRGHPEQLIGEALNAARFIRNGNDWGWNQQQALDALQNVASRDPRSWGGLLVIIDEMGKILEGAARDGADIYFLQQLAEMASRSNGRLIVIGILHQAFEEYAYRLSRETRDEWTKIQGRFVDLTVNAAPDEQIALLGRAIDSDRGSVEPGTTGETRCGIERQRPLWPAEIVGGLLAAASNSSQSAGANISPPVRAKPAEHLWLSQLRGASGVSGFSAAGPG